MLKMSTGRRLAKRSIIGTKVCAPGPDGLWYSGVIQDVKTPPNATVTSASASADNSPVNETKYIVRFDFKTQDANSQQQTSPNKAQRHSSVHISPAQTLRRNAMIKEFRESDLIGPGFRSILGVQLARGQRIYLTYNGRETSGDVLSHDADKDEVMVKITTIGSEEPIELKKRLEEVRLLESRRSARLADQDRDTDFARLADMGGDRRKPSHSIEVPLTATPQQNSRKRPPSYANECNGSPYDEEEMNENNAAMILVTLSLSPKSPKNGEKWLGSSPGSSSASWSSGSSSPPLSDDGHNIGAISNDASASARIRTTSVSTSDEGIVVDFKEDAPRKKRANKTRFVCTWRGCTISEHTKAKIERHIRIVHLGIKKPRRTADHPIDSYSHDSDSHEEEFYYTEVEDDDDDCKTPSPTSPPTLSHRDMARPPHEDPEYQRQLVGSFKHQKQMSNGRHMHHNSNGAGQNAAFISSSQQQQLQNNNTSCIPTSPLAHHNYTWPPAAAVTTVMTISTSGSSIVNNSHNNAAASSYQSQQQHHQQQQQATTPQLIKHARASPRPSQSAAPYPSPTYVHQHHNYSSPAPISPSSSQHNNSSTEFIHNHQSNNSSSNSANSVLQQLSQQNVTVTTHHNSNSHQQHHQQQHQQQQEQHQLTTVTITQNYTNVRGGAKGSGHQDTHHHQHHQQQLQHHHPQHLQQQQSSTIATASNRMVATNPNNSNSSTTTTGTAGGQAHLQQHHQQHVAVQHATKQTPNSPNRRTRGENKKCRKVYGMDRRDMWCTQCRWKKACSRFGD